MEAAFAQGFAFVGLAETFFARAGSGAFKGKNVTHAKVPVQNEGLSGKGSDIRGYGRLIVHCQYSGC